MNGGTHGKDQAEVKKQVAKPTRQFSPVVTRGVSMRRKDELQNNYVVFILQQLFHLGVNCCSMNPDTV